jgi:serine/threonine-protein kinase
MIAHADTAPEGQRALSIRTLIAGLAGLVFVAVAGVGFWAYQTVSAPTTVPLLAGLTPAAASKLLASAHLADGIAYPSVAPGLALGRVSAQAPAAGARVRQDSRVDVQVAVEPHPVTVPDLGLRYAEPSQAALASLMLQPKLLYDYSTAVESGRVIEQLPRAGGSAMTGSEVALVVSLGPGTGGQLVPPVVGMSAGAAGVLVRHATLFTSQNSVPDSAVASGTVLDQIPSAGSRVVATSEVVLSVARPR